MTNPLNNTTRPDKKLLISIFTSNNSHYCKIIRHIFKKIKDLPLIY